MKQATVLPPDAYSDADLAFMVPRALELLYTGEDLRDFACECGWDGPPFRWDEKRRFLVRCELDAAFFHLYLPADALATGVRPTDPMAALSTRPQSRPRTSSVTSPCVCRENETKHRGHLTKRIILEIYDSMLESIPVRLA